MTVKELINELEQMEPNAEVLLESEFLENQHDLEGVKLEFRRNMKTGIDDPVVILFD